MEIYGRSGEEKKGKLSSGNGEEKRRFEDEC